VLLPSYLFEFEFSHFYFFKLRFLRGWTISCRYPNRSVLRKFIIVNVSKNPLLVVSRRNLLLVVSTSTTRGRSDSLTNSSPYMSVDLGARSLVGGVDCNGPEKSPLLEIACYFLFHISLTSCIIMHLSHCIFL
jgi:hypothetical protein